MNAWYIAAIILGAAAAFCTYYGSVVEGRRSTHEQTEQIESRLQDLGNRLQEFRSDRVLPTSTQELDEIEQEYRQVAKEFFESLPLKVAEQRSRDANQLVAQVQRSRAIEGHFRELQEESRRLAQAYNASAGRTVVEVSVSDFPINIFEPQSGKPVHILYKFEGGAFWMARITMYPDRTPALQFVRVQSPDGSDEVSRMGLTNDSINLIFSGDEFWISLNQSISEEVKQNVLGGLTIARRPMSEFDQSAGTIARRLIEHQMLMNRASRGS